LDTYDEKDGLFQIQLSATTGRLLVEIAEILELPAREKRPFRDNPTN
jgi:hypothetical protein